MWNNYFFQIQKKYDMRISLKEPFVIRFDGKNVTKNKEIDLLDRFPGSFLDSLTKTAIYFSKKYQCYALFGSDEISFIIPDPMMVINDLEADDQCNYSHELLALFSQHFFDYFNHFDTKKKIFWHGKCFSIPSGKVSSYIKYRVGIVKNVIITYFAKQNKVNNQSGLLEKEKMCESLPGYQEVNNIKNGFLYYNGARIDLGEFLISGNIKNFEDEKIIEKDNNIYNEDIEIEML